MMQKPIVAVRMTAVGISLFYTSTLFLSGLELAKPINLFLGALPILAVGALLVWDVYLWRTKLFQKMNRRPDLRGLWSVEIFPASNSGTNPEFLQPRSGFIEIKQSYWSINIRLMTQESLSESLGPSWVQNPALGVDQLNYLFQNQPKAAFSHRSTRNIGACSFEISSLRPKEFSGRYFSDRQSLGDIRSVFVDRSTGYPSYEAADGYSSDFI